MALGGVRRGLHRRASRRTDVAGAQQCLVAAGSVSRRHASESCETSRMPWELGQPLTDVHRGRLVAAGADPEALGATELRELIGPLPAWWRDNGNALFATAELAVAAPVMERLCGYPFTDT